MVFWMRLKAILWFGTFCNGDTRLHPIQNWHSRRTEPQSFSLKFSTLKFQKQRTNFPCRNGLSVVFSIEQWELVFKHLPIFNFSQPKTCFYVQVGVFLTQHSPFELWQLFWLRVLLTPKVFTWKVLLTRDLIILNQAIVADCLNSVW